MSRAQIREGAGETVEVGGVSGGDEVDVSCSTDYPVGPERQATDDHVHDSGLIESRYNPLGLESALAAHSLHSLALGKPESIWGWAISPSTGLIAPPASGPPVLGEGLQPVCGFRPDEHVYVGSWTVRVLSPAEQTLHQVAPDETSHPVTK